MVRKSKTGYTLKADAGKSKVTGLSIRTTAAGARSYVFERRLHGRTVRVTIGRVDDPWTLKDARAKARSISVGIDEGEDPRITAATERARAEAARIDSQRHKHMVATVWAAYIDDRRAAFDAKRRKPLWGERHHHMHDLLAAPGGQPKKRGKGLTTAGPLAPLMRLKLSELTPETIEAWLKREVADRPTNAHQSYRLLHAFVNWTHSHKVGKERPYRGIVAADACTDSDVVKAVPSSNTRDGDCLQSDMLKKWFKAVRHLHNKVVGAYLQVLLLTGARRNELAGLKWADVDFAWNAMTIRDKVDGKRTIPLTPFIAQLLGTLPRKNKWVFSSARAVGGRLMEPRIAHNDALEAAGLPHISIHGLRRSFATLSDHLDEMPAGIIAQIQGHKPSGVREKNYKRREIDILRKWHTKLEAWILEQAGVQFTPLPVPGRLGVVASDGSVRAAV